MPLLFAYDINRFSHDVAQVITAVYNTMTQNVCFIKGSHKYDIYSFEENKAHIN